MKPSAMTDENMPTSPGAGETNMKDAINSAEEEAESFRILEPVSESLPPSDELEVDKLVNCVNFTAPAPPPPDLPTIEDPSKV